MRARRAPYSSGLSDGQRSVCPARVLATGHRVRAIGHMPANARGPNDLIRLSMTRRPGEPQPRMASRRYSPGRDLASAPSGARRAGVRVGVSTFVGRPRSTSGYVTRRTHPVRRLPDVVTPVPVRQAFADHDAVSLIVRSSTVPANFPTHITW